VKYDGEAVTTRRAVLFSLVRYGEAGWLFVLSPWSEKEYPPGYG
jgi:hypothetical protein